MKLGRTTLIIATLLFGLSTITFAQSTTKSVVTEITPGGRTIGGPVVYVSDSTGVGSPLYAALSRLQLDVCITFAFVQGKTEVSYFSASGSGHFLVEANPMVYCVPGLSALIPACLEPPCKFVYRIDRAN